MKKILILTVLTGMGHIKAAEAIAKGIKELKPDVEVKTGDPMANTFPQLQHLFNNVYLFLVNYIPPLWGWIYNSRILSADYSPFRWYGRRMYAKSIKCMVDKFKLDEFKPDIIVSTHPFIADGVGRLKEQKIINLPLISVATDYHVHPFGINKFVDLFIVPSSQVALYLKNKGIQDEKIRISGGLATDPKFFKPHNKNHLRQIFGLQKDLKVVLILCGGFGMGRGYVTKVLESFIDVDFPLQLLVVAGKNEKLKAKLTQISKQLKIKTKIFGFVENMEEILDVSDVVVTKPGGASIAEALTKGLPIILIHTVPGQEKWNVDMLLNERMAIQPKNLAEIPALIMEVFSQKDTLQEMKQRVNEKFAKTKAVYNIAKILMEEVL